MKKIISALVIAGLLAATSAAPASADENYGISVFNPLWPVATALSIPAAIVASVVDPGARVPVVLPTVPVPAPVVYAPPVVYSAPYYAPAPYYGASFYVGPRYYGPRGYYRGYRVYRRGW